VSSADEQRASIEENNNSLAKLKKSDFALNIGANDFDNVLIPAIDSLINRKNEIKKIKSYSLDRLVSSTDKEQITISSNFQVTLDTLNASISGKLIGTVTFAFRNDSLILFPAFKYIHVEDISYKKTTKLERKVIADIINLALHLFINKLNGYMDSKNFGDSIKSNR